MSREMSRPIRLTPWIRRNYPAKKPLPRRYPEIWAHRGLGVNSTRNHWFKHTTSQAILSTYNLFVNDIPFVSILETVSCGATGGGKQASAHNGVGWLYVEMLHVATCACPTVLGPN